MGAYVPGPPQTIRHSFRRNYMYAFHSHHSCSSFLFWLLVLVSCSGFLFWFLVLVSCSGFLFSFLSSICRDFLYQVPMSTYIFLNYMYTTTLRSTPAPAVLTYVSTLFVFNFFRRIIFSWVRLHAPAQILGTIRTWSGISVHELKYIHCMGSTASYDHSVSTNHKF
jgi:hypothetical protein